MTILLCTLAFAGDALKSAFVNPPANARPCVYWYFMEGNMTREGMTADLESMKKAGLGGGIFLEVDLGIPRGPVKYMSPEWRKMLGHAVKEADRLGLEINLGTGPGWCGTGGSWVTPDQAMQHLVSAEVEVQGPTTFKAKLPQPKPRVPFFGMGSLPPELEKQWASYYRDEVVVAIPTPVHNQPLVDLDEKALVFRAPYSSQPGVKPFLWPDKQPNRNYVPVLSKQVVDLTANLKEGELTWQVPEGKWTILRFGRTLTGQTSRPAPAMGLGFETDKFETPGITAHLDHYVDAIVKETGPNRTPGQGLTSLHFDSWEMSSQNWSAHFRSEFIKRRGYDPLPYLPVMAGKIVDSADVSERFLWDLRQTAQELLLANHMGTIKARAKKYGLGLSIEPYDMNPAADLVLGSAADVPMCEFWSKGYGYDSEYSCFEAVSVAHTGGHPIVGAESFTSDDSDAWLQHPASMKAQADWALATGINKLYFHRFEHQPKEGEFPGMTMGPYGVHWERTQTWWDMIAPFHAYLSRSQHLLRQGLPVADVLYLLPQGAPNVFQVPSDAVIGVLPDRRGYNFDACSSDRLIEAAQVKDGKIVFPDGMSYRLLVLPRTQSMTPRLIQKVDQLVRAGAVIVGRPVQGSPSLEGYPNCDGQIREMSSSLWGKAHGQNGHAVGKGRVYAEHESTPSPAHLNEAQWIWTDEGNPLVAAPVGERTFSKTFTLNPNQKVASAMAAFTADNIFHLKINGHAALEGANFHKIQQADLARYLQTGENRIEVVVKNDGTSPNPAGLLGTLEVRYNVSPGVTINTDATWQAEGHKTQALGAWTTQPWSLSEGTEPPKPMYPSYEFTAALLQRALNLAPDLESNDALRYSHRIFEGRDIYFVANRSDKTFEGNPTFRVAIGTPEWWDPMTGKSRPLPQYTRTADGRTTIPMRLEGNQSGFIVFETAKSKATGENFPVLHEAFTLEGPWNVAFETRFGGPASATFASLTDWSQNQEESIRYYSGNATYTKTFAASTTEATTLDLGEVKNMASVKLNGRDLGVAWCAPWRLQIPAGTLKPNANHLEITVANLWPNRLIGDSKLPPEKRITKTTWSPYTPDSPLLPSGLLGPVRFLK